MAPRPSLLRIQSALWLLLAACAPDVAAVPYPRDDLRAAGYGYLLPRQCDQVCGYNGMYCCERGTQCTTSNGIAGCSAAAGGGYAWYTTIWTVTQTFTSTYNSFIPAATAPAGSEKCVPPEGSGQIACGNICCAKWQYCAHDGQCMANIPAPQPLPTASNIMTTAGPAVTTAFSAPYRVTSGTFTATATGTGAFATSTDGAGAGGEESGGGGLSGGAIAGIVVGTIAGVALLLLICACCIARGLWHGLLAVLGIGKKKGDGSSGHSHRDNHSSWFGGGGGRPSSASGRKEKSSKGGGLLGIGAALATLALLLGLRRDKKKKSAGTARTRSDIGSGSYSWSQSYTATSPSEAPPIFTPTPHPDDSPLLTTIPQQAPAAPTAAPASRRATAAPQVA